MSEIDTLRAQLAAAQADRERAAREFGGEIEALMRDCDSLRSLWGEWMQKAFVAKDEHNKARAENARLAAELERRTAERDEWRMRRDNARESAESRGRTLERVATDRDRLAEEVQAARATEREAVRLMTEHGEEMLRLRAEVERLRYLETDRDKWASMAEALAGDISRLRAALEPTEANVAYVGARVGRVTVAEVMRVIRAGLDAEPRTFAELTSGMPPLGSTALATDDSDAEPQAGEVKCHACGGSGILPVLNIAGEEIAGMPSMPCPLCRASDTGKAGG